MARSVWQAICVRCLTVASFAILSVGPVHAESCGPNAPWVQMHIDGRFSGLERRILLELRASMRRRGIAVCTHADARRGRPRLHVELSEFPEGARMTAGTTGTEVEFRRDVDLGSVPSDARAFTLATIVDEALRSRWPHLLPAASDGEAPGAAKGPHSAEPAPDTGSRDKPSSENAVPHLDDRARPAAASSERDSKPVSPRSEARARWAPTVSGRFRSFATGLAWLEAGGGARLAPGRWLELEFGALAGRSLKQSLDIGSVDGRRAGATLLLATVVWEANRAARVAGFVGADIGAVWLSGNQSGTRRNAAASPNVNLELGPELRARFGSHIELTLAGSIGGAILATYGTDGAHRVTGTARLVGGGRLGVLLWP